MFSLALALFAQSGTLPEDTAQAARLCGSAVEKINAAARDEHDSRAAFFALVAVRANRGTGDFNARLAEEAKTILDGRRSADAGIGAACRKRFPKAWASSITLPADSFDRRFLCLMASGFAVGLMEGTGNTALAKRYTAINERFLGYIPDTDFNARGITTPQQASTLAEKTLLATTDLGHPLAVMSACETAFPG